MITLPCVSRTTIGCAVGATDPNAAGGGGSSIEWGEVLGYLQYSGDGSTFFGPQGSGTHEAVLPISLPFTGTEYIDLAETVTLVGDFTVSFKFKLDSFTTNSRTLLGSTDSANYIRAAVSITAIHININNVTQSYSTLLLSVGVLYELEMVRSGASVSITVNGVTETNIVSSDTMTFNKIGARGSAATEPLDGTIYDIEVTDSTGLIYKDSIASGYIASNPTILTNPAVGPVGTLVGFSVNPWLNSYPGYSWNEETHFYGQNQFLWSEDFSNIKWVFYLATELGGNVFQVSNTSARLEQRVVMYAGDKFTFTLELTSDKGMYAICTTANVAGDGLEYRVEAGVRTKIVWTGEFIATTIDEFILLDECDIDGNATATIELHQAHLECGGKTSDYIKTEDIILQGHFPEDPNNPGYTTTGTLCNRVGKSRQTPTTYGYTVPWDGVIYLTLPHLTGSETVTSYAGTVEPVISAGQIDIPTGICTRIVLSDGTDLVVEGDPAKAQTLCYNLDGTGRHAAIVDGPAYSFTEASVYADYLANNGGTVQADAIYPAALGTDLDIYGNPLDFSNWSDKDCPSVHVWPATKEVIEVDTSEHNSHDDETTFDPAFLLFDTSYIPKDITPPMYQWGAVELVSNGTFDDGLDGWDDWGDNLLVVSEGKCLFYNASGGSSGLYVYTDDEVPIGSYRLTFEAINVVGNPTFYLSDDYGDWAINDEYPAIVEGPNTYDFDLPWDLWMSLNFMPEEAANSGFVLDNVSLKQTGVVSNTLNYLYWKGDNSNLLFFKTPQTDPSAIDKIKKYIGV